MAAERTKLFCRNPAFTLAETRFWQSATETPKPNSAADLLRTNPGATAVEMTEYFFSLWRDVKSRIADAEEAYEKHPTQKHLGPGFVTVDADSPFELPEQGSPLWERCPQGDVHKDDLTVLLGVLNEELIDEAMAAKPKPKEMDKLFGYDLWRQGSEFSRKHSARTSKTVELERGVKRARKTSEGQRRKVYETV